MQKAKKWENSSDPIYANSIKNLPKRVGTFSSTHTFCTPPPHITAQHTKINIEKRPGTTAKETKGAKKLW